MDASYRDVVRLISDHHKILEFIKDMLLEKQEVTGAVLRELVWSG
jgi:ATP-dependent Zn protease